MATIQKRKLKNGGVRYRVQVRRYDQPALSKSFGTRGAASEWARNVEQNIDVAIAQLKPGTPKHTLAELIELYIKDKDPDGTKINHLLWWKSRLGYKLLTDIEPVEISDALRGLRNSDKRMGGTTVRVAKGQRPAPATVNRYHVALSSALSYAVSELYWLDENPARKVKRQKENNTRQRWLSDTERVALIEACGESSWGGLLPLVWLALSTGARQSTLINLRWSQIDLQRARAHIPTTKNGQPITLSIVGDALEELIEWGKDRQVDCDWVFPSPRTPLKPHAGYRVHWDRALKEAGIKNFRFHDLRHTCASYLAQNNISQPIIMKVLGHKTLAASQRYVHLSVDDQEAALLKVFGK